MVLAYWLIFVAMEEMTVETIQMKWTALLCAGIPTMRQPFCTQHVFNLAHLETVSVV